MAAMCGKADARQYFFIERPQLGVHLSYEHDKISRLNPVTENENTSNHYKEVFEIATSGWVYHPALIEYSLGFSPAWDQSRGHSLASTTTSNSFFTDYSADVVIMQYKPYSLRLFGNRLTTSIQNNFAEKTTSETDLMGARLNLVYRNFRSYLESVQTNSERSGFSNSSRDDWETSIVMNHGNKYTHTTLSGRYQDSSTQTSDSLININRFGTLLHNRYDIKGLIPILKKDVSLDSSFKYDVIDNTNARNRSYSINETLTVSHGSQLSTSYNMDYNKINNFVKTGNENDRSESKGVGFNLRHMLYENLVTSIEADAVKVSSRIGRDSILNTSIEWDYSRNIPWGKLVINTGYLYSILDNKVRIDTQSTFLVQDESLTLTSGVITVLTNDFVDTSTVRITQLESFNGLGITYVEGTDYDIELTGDRTRIIRKPGGAIVNGQTVFVEYRYIPSPAFDYSFFSQNYGVKVNLWSSWDIYYHLTRSKQSYIDGTPPDDFESFDEIIHIAGTEYNWKWSRTVFEWEDQYSTSNAYEKWRADEIMTFRPRSDIFLILSTSYRHTAIKESNRTVDFISASSNIQWKLTNRSYLTVDGSWTDTSGDVQELTDLIFATLYKWRFRIWDLNIEYEFNRARDKKVYQTFTRHHFMIELERELF